MTLDLTAPRATAEATLTATCTITYDAQRHGDDVLNEATGALEPPDPDDTTLYTGPCTVRPTAAERVGEEGGVVLYLHTYRLLLPVTAEPVIGAVATIDAVGDDGDPALVGRELIVTEVAYSSRTVLRRATAVDRRPGPAL